MILATKSSMPIIGQVASILGWVMNGIYKVLDGLFGIQNLGLCIIIFSILIYLFMTPLQIKQQKFSKLSAIMQPEIQKIQKKYKGKKDQDSQMKMNEETMAVYAKYGVSPTGSCVQLLIQMPILLSLWQVIQNIPAYVDSVRAIFDSAVMQITSVNGFVEIVNTFITDNKMTRVRQIAEGATQSQIENSLVDFLYALSPSQWDSLSEISQFASFTDVIDSTAREISKLQTFGVLNIADQPLNIITTGIKTGAIIAVIAAVAIPVLSWVTQMLNIKLMPQPAQNDDQSSTMNASMKTMNTFMPLMSAFFCFSFPVGLGIYWIASSVVRSIQQVIINRHLDKIDINELIAKNQKKMEKKREKAGLPPQKITNQAHQNVKKINTRVDKGDSGKNVDERARKVEEAYQKASSAKPGSITAKANMVRDYNERNKKK